MSANKDFGLPEVLPSIVLTLRDGKDYTLTPLSVDGLRSLQVMGSDIDEMDDEDKGLEFLKLLMREALKFAHPDLKPEQADTLIPASWLQLGAEGLTKLMSALGVAAEVSAKPSDPTT